MFDRLFGQHMIVWRSATSPGSNPPFCSLPSRETRDHRLHRGGNHQVASTNHEDDNDVCEVWRWFQWNLRMGATVKMVCQAHGGNPLAQVSPSSCQNQNYHQNQVIWFKNNQRIDHSYTTTGARSENTFMFLAQVSHYHMSIWNLECVQRTMIQLIIILAQLSHQKGI